MATDYVLAQNAEALRKEIVRLLGVASGHADDAGRESERSDG